MKIDFTALIGYVAACLTTASFIPQAIKVYRTGSTSAISLWMFLMFNTGIICWFIYGILLNKYPMILANAVTMIFSFYILYKKIRNTLTGE